MPTCGNCKQQGQSIEHIRGCYAAKKSSVAVLDRPMALETSTVPDSKYAMLDVTGKIVFYEVSTGKGKWSHMQFVSRLVGHPGDFMKYPVKGESKRQVLLAIGADAKSAAVAFGKHFTVCAACGSPLSDPDSIAAGMGPVCATRF
jgi:hypothetical protein